MIVITVFFLLMIACINDFLFFRIEDILHIALVTTFFIGYFTGYIDSDIWHALCIASLCFVISVILNHYDLLGGGDVKLLFSIGLFVSSNMAAFLCSLSVYSLIIALIYISYGQKIERIRTRLSDKVFHMKSRNSLVHKILFPSAHSITDGELQNFKQSECILKQEIPYGVILSLSTISSMLCAEMNIGGL